VDSGHFIADIEKHFRSGRWEPAGCFERRFVKHRNPDASPATVWRYCSQNSAILLSILIPTLDANRNGYFPELLRQLGNQKFLDYEIIIIKGDPRQGRAINIGAELAKGSYLLTLDDDTFLPDSDILGSMVAAMQTNPDIGMAGGNSIIPEHASPFLKKIMQQIPRRSWKPVDEITDSDLAEHPLLIMRRDIFLKIGGENELIPRGLDPYLRQQFRLADHRVVVIPKVLYAHLPPASLAKLIKQFYRNGRQAAFCNVHFPQWVIETPPDHCEHFVARRPFLYRAARHLVNFVKKGACGHWLYICLYTVYALGFLAGFLMNVGKDPFIKSSA
jgi:glycosyltransferase involved in cell wall biosynthesis